VVCAACLQRASRKLVCFAVLVSVHSARAYRRCDIVKPSFGSIVLARLHPGENNTRLFHDQIILYGFDPFDAACDLTRFIDRLLRINEAAELDAALVSLDTDLE